jgi:hypothetical protein
MSNLSTDFFEADKNFNHGALTGYSVYKGLRTGFVKYLAGLQFILH